MYIWRKRCKLMREMKKDNDRKKFITGVYIGAVIGIIIALSYFLLYNQSI